MPALLLVRAVMRWMIAIMACGCRSILGFEEPSLASDATDGSLCVDGFTPVCLAALASDPLTIPGGSIRTINTNNDPLCQQTTMGTAPGICVVSATSIDIEDGAVLTATGVQPLLLIANTISIKGTLDVASHRGGALGAGAVSDQDNLCNLGTAPTDLNNSGGGGYGGTFGGIGGSGGSSMGRGVGGLASSSTIDPTTLRAGCAGATGARVSAGLGGAGGGAVELTATVISIDGTINASGAGGEGGTINDGGGGGGGSGGMIVFSTQNLMLGSTGAVFAQGGAGGGGAGMGAATSGLDPVTADIPALPGAGYHDAGGTGGGGGAGATNATGGAGENSNLIGGGGGGGGAGAIRTTGDPIRGNVVPPFE